ncbi:hypothetical protein OKC48_23795 [Methylorubrum extorquens]|uniref:hypothetical protein n=1 Tax=Methylorubrum extorquens TaxID=408 RepID=UPI00223872D2|nr:hypothetical protein [Methylorubrum extorquens]UYW26256.1 hypothetical protein OKC48_23795 [Methylorubrum extorquens]
MGDVTPIRREAHRHRDPLVGAMAARLCLALADKVAAQGLTNPVIATRAGLVNGGRFRETMAAVRRRDGEAGHFGTLLRVARALHMPVEEIVTGAPLRRAS